MRQQNDVTVCKSTPNLIGIPKVYPYEMLRRNREKKAVLTTDIDRERLERHLSPDEFQEIFDMNIEQFYNLSEWQRVNLKKKAKLF
jgi:actin-binding LIM protein